MAKRVADRLEGWQSDARLDGAIAGIDMTKPLWR